MMQRIFAWLAKFFTRLAYRVYVPKNLLESPPDASGSRVTGVKGGKVYIETKYALPPADRPVTNVGGVWVCTGCLEATNNCKCNPS